MSTLIRYKLDDGTEVYFEAPEEMLRGRQPMSNEGKSQVIDENEKLSSLLSRIQPAADMVLKSFRDINTPKEICLEFSLKLKADVGFVFASGGSESTFKVSLKWENNSDMSSK